MYQMFNFCPMLRLGKLTFLQMTGKIVLKPLRRKTKKEHQVTSFSLYSVILPDLFFLFSILSLNIFTTNSHITLGLPVVSQEKRDRGRE